MRVLHALAFAEVDCREQFGMVDDTSDDGYLDNYIGGGIVLSVLIELISNISVDKLHLNLDG